MAQRAGIHGIESASRISPAVSFLPLCASPQHTRLGRADCPSHAPLLGAPRQLSKLAYYLNRLVLRCCRNATIKTLKQLRAADCCDIAYNKCTVYVDGPTIIMVFRPPR